MSRKLVKRLMSAALATALVLGMSVSAYAATCTEEGCTVDENTAGSVRYESNLNGTHNIVCNAHGNVLATEDCSGGYGWAQEGDSGWHAEFCSKCHTQRTTREDCTWKVVLSREGDWMVSKKICEVCHFVYPGSYTQLENLREKEEAAAKAREAEAIAKIKEETKKQQEAEAKAREEANAKAEAEAATEAREREAEASRQQAEAEAREREAEATQMTAAEVYEQQEVATPVESFVSESAVAALPSDVVGYINNTNSALAAERADGTMPTTKVYNISKIVTPKGLVAAVDKVAKNTPDEAVTVFHMNYVPFTDSVISAITKNNKDFVYIFKHAGHTFSITIPAGASTDNLVKGKFYGPLYIGAVYGTTKMID